MQCCEAWNVWAHEHTTQRSLCSFSTWLWACWEAVGLPLQKQIWIPALHTELTRSEAAFTADFRGRCTQLTKNDFSHQTFDIKDNLCTIWWKCCIKLNAVYYFSMARLILLLRAFLNTFGFFNIFSIMECKFLLFCLNEQTIMNMSYS